MALFRKDKPVVDDVKNDIATEPVTKKGLTEVEMKKLAGFADLTGLEVNLNADSYPEALESLLTNVIGETEKMLTSYSGFNKKQGQAEIPVEKTFSTISEALTYYSTTLKMTNADALKVVKEKHPKLFERIQK